MLRRRKARQSVEELNDAVATLYGEGRFDEAEGLAVRAVELADRDLHPDDLSRAVALNNLGELCRLAVSLDDAQRLHEAALDIRMRVFGRSDPTIAQSLQNLGLVSAERRDWDLARNFHANAFEMRRECLGDRHPMTAQSLYSLGVANVELGETDVGFDQLELALDVERHAYGVGTDEPATTLLTLGMMARQAGRLDRAEALYRSERELLRAHDLVHGPYYEQVVDGLAAVHEAQGRFRDAADELGELIAEMRTDGRSETRSFRAGLNNLAEALHLAGEYTTALEIAEECLRLQRAASDSTDGLRTVLSTVGRLRQVLGDLDGAERVLREAIEVADGEHGVALNNLGSVLRQKGDVAEAQTMFERARAVLRTSSGEDDLDFAVASNNLGGLFLELGDTAAAGPLLEVGLAVRQARLGAHHPDIAQSHSNLAYLEHVTGGRHGIQHLQEAVRILQAGRSAGPQLAAALNNLAVEHWVTGNRSAALATIRQCLELCRHEFGEDHPDTARAWRQFAELNYFAGELDKCDEGITRAIDIQQQLGLIGTGYTESLLLSACLSATNGDASRALATATEATEASGRLIGAVFSGGTEARRLAFLATLSTELDVYLSVVLAFHLASAGAVRRAFELVLGRKGLSAEALAVQRDAILTADQPQLRAELDRLRTIQREVASITLEGRGGPGSRRLLDDLRAEREQLERELASEIPAIGRVHELGSASGLDVVARIPAEATLVDFLRIQRLDFTDPGSPGADHYVVFVVDGRAPHRPRLIDLGPAEPIDRAVDELLTTQSLLDPRDAAREDGCAPVRTSTDAQDVELGREVLAAASAVGSPEAIRERGHALRRTLIDPLDVDPGRTLIVSADSQLLRLPFGILPTEDGARIIDDHEVDYVTVPRDLRFWGARARAQNPALVVGDPDFDADGGIDVHETPPFDGPHRSPQMLRAGISFQRLPGTRREATDIAQLLAVEPCTGGNATKGLVAGCRSPSALHVASHGFFLPLRARPTSIAIPWLDSDAEAPGLGRLSPAASAENPLLRSGIALAGANTWLTGHQPPREAGNGLLLAEEVSGLDLVGTSLVVLSACETGIGDLAIGEGVFGLRRAFRLAGAETLVISLWKVPDESTRLLMTEFYQRLVNGEPAGSALRSAQLTMKSTTTTATPMHWGGFILEGDPGPIRGLINAT